MKASNEAVQATAAAPPVFSGPGDSLLLGFIVAQSPAAVPDLVRSATGGGFLINNYD